MKKIGLTGVLLIMTLCIWGFEPHFAKDPAISPDGKEVCFVYRGDLWKVATQGGTAIRLTDTEDAVYSPIYSPNGQDIAFVANREGFTAIYTIPQEGGQIERISDANFSLSAWYPDGKSILASRYNARLGTGFYKINLTDNSVTEIAPIGGAFPTISEDSNVIVYSDRGHPYREAYQGSTNGELWKYTVSDQSYEKLTSSDVTERYAEFSRANPNYLYYAKSDGEIFQLFRVNNFDFAQEEQLTSFSTWSVRDISIARSGDKVVFEKFDEIWLYDDSAENNKKTKKIEINIREIQEENSLVRKNVVNGFADFEVSRNDDFIVFNYAYDLFIMPVAGGPVKQITYDQVPFRGIRILNDNRTVVVMGREKGQGKLYKFTIDEPEKIEQIEWTKDYIISSISETECGNYLITYYTDKHGQQVAIADSTLSLFTNIDFNNYFISEYADRVNSRYLAYVDYDYTRRVSYLYLRDTVLKESYLLYNSYKSIYNLVWGKDDKSLFFSEDGNIRRLDLHPIDKLSDYSDPWENILAGPQEITNATSDDTPHYPELNVKLSDLNSRISTIVSSPGYNYVISVVNDSTLYYVNSDKSTSFYQMNYDGDNLEKITSIDDRSYYSFNKLSDNYYYNDGNKLKYVNLRNRSTGEIVNSFFYEYDMEKVRHQVFREVWGQFGIAFYDANMHGVDWDALYTKYEPYLEYTYDEETLSNIVDEMIGEVNASHTGFSQKYSHNSFSYEVGRIGAEFDYSNRPKKGIKFKRIYEGTSLKDFYQVEPGDLLLAVNGQAIDRNSDIDSFFFNTVQRKIKLSIKKQKGKEFDVWVQGLTWRENSNLEYQDWVNTRRKIVDQKSLGKIAYLHIRGMNRKAYVQFLEDFWNDNIKKDGFIIDVRGNGGGNISEELVEAIRKKPLSLSSYRSYGPDKFKTPNKYYDKPIVVLIDEDSFSDAEVFPHLMQEQKLGTIIGMPTSGSVIGTYDIDLFDGSSLRLPRSGWWTLSGINMEGNGVQPDVKVELSPEDKIMDNDIQLDTAIEYLLNNK